MDSNMMQWHFDYVRLAWDSGFFFGNSKQNDKVDYSIIGLVDIEKISRDRDYATVEKHIPTIINFTLQEELSKVLEPTFVKLFKLAQLSVEYLQFCKKYLDNTVILLKKELNDRQSTCDNLKKDCENLNQYTGNLKKKNKDLKAHLQFLEAQHVLSFHCPHCNKLFSSQTYLEAHVNRRHADALLEPPLPTNMQIEADKLQLEIKELKERLNSSEKFVQAEQSSENTVHKNDIHNKLELHRQHVETELEAIRLANAFRYEQLSETMMQKFQESEKMTLKPTADVHSHDTADKGCYNTIAIEESTQTEYNVQYVDSNVNTDVVLLDTNSVEGINSITEQHLYEFTKVLEQQVSNNLAHLETKLETLFNKCSVLQTTQNVENNLVDQMPLDISPINENNSVKEPEVPKPAPRRQHEIIPLRNISILPKPRSKVLTSTENNMFSGYMTKDSPRDVTFIKSPQKIISTSSDSGSSTESDSDSTSSDGSKSEIEVVPKPVPDALKPTVKISNTSTLRDRSVTSLRKAVDENVTGGLSKEIENILNQKLQSIGVSAEWKGIPKKSFDHAIKIIHHQNKSVIKNFPNYKKHRESILLRLQKKVKEILSNKKSTSRPKPAIPRRIKSTRYSEKKKNSATNPNFITKQRPISPIRSPSTSVQQFEIESSIKPVKTAVQTGKKRVLFDLDTDESSGSISTNENKAFEVVTAAPVPLLTITGSTTSVASSVLDEPNKELIGTKEEDKKKLDEQAKKSMIIEEDISDWDLSDILAS